MMRPVSTWHPHNTFQSASVRAWLCPLRLPSSLGRDLVPSCKARADGDRPLGQQRQAPPTASTAPGGDAQHSRQRPAGYLHGSPSRQQIRLSPELKVRKHLQEPPQDRDAAHVEWQQQQQHMLGLAQRQQQVEEQQGDEQQQQLAAEPIPVGAQPGRSAGYLLKRHRARQHSPVQWRPQRTPAAAAAAAAAAASTDAAVTAVELQPAAGGQQPMVERAGAFALSPLPHPQQQLPKHEPLPVTQPPAAFAQPQPPKPQLQPPRKFEGIMREQLRPWQRQVVEHLCCTLPPPACYVYVEMTPASVQHVIAQRAVVEKELRQQQEEARWQLRRLRAWLRLVRDSGRMLDPQATFLRGAREVQQLKAEVGATLGRLRRLRAKAQAYCDQDHLRYSAPLAGMLQEVSAFCDVYRVQYVRYALAVLDANERARRDVLLGRIRHADVEDHRQRLVGELAPLQWERPPPDPDQQLHAMQWRYPPAEFVLVKRKGVRGGWMPPLVLPGLQPRAPPVRPKELLPDAQAAARHANSGFID